MVLPEHVFGLKYIPLQGLYLARWSAVALLQRFLLISRVAVRQFPVQFTFNNNVLYMGLCVALWTVRRFSIMCTPASCLQRFTAVTAHFAFLVLHKLLQLSPRVCSVLFNSILNFKIANDCFKPREEQATQKAT